MSFQRIRAAWAIVTVILCAATACIAADAATAPSLAAKDLPVACRAAKTQFRPLTQTDATQAKAELLEAVARLDQRLTDAGENGNAWRKYLHWGQLQAELQNAQGANIEVLKEIRDLYAADCDGLDLVWFLDVQRTLRNYVGIVHAVDNQQMKAEYEKLLDTLAAKLDAYAAKPTTDDALVIGDVVRWLESARQAPELVDAIQHCYVQPNMTAELSAAVVGAGIAEPIDDTTPVRDCIMGTDIYGTAHTTGKTSVELSPHDTLGVIDTLFFGSTVTNNVGYHGPVTIYSSGNTQLAARKRLWIDANGISAHPAASNAATDINICNIQSKKDRNMVEKMAWKKAGKQLGAVECIASRHAEARLNERVDQQALEPMAKANQNYEEKFRRPFTERKLFPQDLKFSTSAQALQIVGLQAGNSRLAAPTAPPSVVEGADMAVRIHESMINNLAADALSGRTIHEEKLQQAVTDTLGHLPEKMKGDDDGQPWAITFARRQPISVTFADDGFKITIRGAKFFKGKEAHPGMDISASYKIEKVATGFKAIRQGPITVLPPDFVPGTTKIDAKRLTVAKLLEKRFAKIFEPEMLGEGFLLPGKWKAAGKMQPIQVTSHDGWLVIAWKCSPESPQVAAAK